MRCRATSRYTRLLGTGGRYMYRTAGSTHVLVSGMAGRITSERDQAPLFERFTLGDSSTLRGWNKSDIAPAGGEHVFHTSVEYRHRGVALFLDSGSVWDRDADLARPLVRRLWLPSPDNVFLTLGSRSIPTTLDAVFMAGVRF